MASILSEFSHSVILDSGLFHNRGKHGEQHALKFGTTIQWFHLGCLKELGFFWDFY